jgi:hypothetical protein
MMRVLILVDESFAARERAMLARLEVGLADDGARIIHGVPQRAAHWYEPGLFSQTLTYQDRGLAISRSWRARRFIDALRETVGDDERPVDLVHVFGISAWPIAAEVVHLTGAALAVEVSSAAAAFEALRLRADFGTSTPVFFVPDAALEKIIRGDLIGIQVRVNPWGVHTPARKREILGPHQGVSVFMAGTGDDPDAWIAVLEALAACSKSVPDLMIFVDAHAAERSGIWAHVSRLGLRERLTLAPDLEARRELTLAGDVLVLPEAHGVHRSLTLDAMAAGLLVIAAADPLVSLLVEGRTARLVERTSPEAWTAVLRRAFEDRAESVSLASAARDHVKQSCRASSHVAAVMGSYEWMLAGETIPFGTAS